VAPVVDRGPCIDLAGNGSGANAVADLVSGDLVVGIPFALVPLVRIAADHDLMHLAPTRRGTIGVAWLVIGVVTALNLILIVLTVSGL
jgi:manganese transport protein